MKIRFPYQSGSGKFAGHYEDKWEGIRGNVERRYRETQSETVRNQLDEFMSTLPCTACGGSRLKAASLAVTIEGRSLGEIVEMSVEEAVEFIDRSPDHGDAPPQVGRSAAPGGDRGPHPQGGR